MFDHVSKMSTAKSPVKPALGHYKPVGKIDIACTGSIGGEITMLYCAGFRKKIFKMYLCKIKLFFKKKKTLATVYF